MSEQMLLVEVDGRRCAVPVSAVREVVHAAAVEPLPGGPRAVDGLCVVRGHVVPVISLRARLQLSERPLRSSDYFVIADFHGRTVALRVDDILGLTEAAVQAPPSGLAHPTMRGVASIDEAVIVVHDVDASLDDADREALERVLPAGDPVPRREDGPQGPPVPSGVREPPPTGGSFPNG